MKAVGEFIIAKFEEPSERLDNGLYRPIGSINDHKTGEVIRVGSKVNDVKIGDKIITHFNSGTKVSVDGIDYTIIKEDQVLMIL